MTRRLFLTPRSPYARKVRIVLLEKGLDFEPVWVDFSNRSPEFLAASPLGKVPAFVDADGTVIFDSTVIAEYLEDRHPERALLGRGWAERLENRAIEELGDTVADQAVAAWQSRARDDATGEDRALALAKKALTELEQRGKAGRWPGYFGLGDAAVISALGYFELRHGRALLEGFPEVLRRAAMYADRPSVASTVPQG